jgi:hypothetical protein
MVQREELLRFTWLDFDDEGDVPFRVGANVADALDRKHRVVEVHIALILDRLAEFYARASDPNPAALDCPLGPLMSSAEG